MWDCETKEETRDITPYIMPREGGANGAKATNYVKLVGVNHSALNTSKYTYPVELTIDYTGEEPKKPRFNY
jgi:hypothetical protein